LGQGFITERPACIEWNDRISELETHADNLRTIHAEAEKEYRKQAQLNCYRDIHHSVSLAAQNLDILKFCEKSRYPKDKIPFMWTGQLEKPEKNNPLGLTYFAIDAITKQKLLEQSEDSLQEKVSQKPLLCRRVEQA